MSWCTNIAESGVDIPNVNTIIIANNAHQFDLSDFASVCGMGVAAVIKKHFVIFAPPMSTFTTDSRNV